VFGVETLVFALAIIKCCWVAKCLEKLFYKSLTEFCQFAKMSNIFSKLYQKREFCENLIDNYWQSIKGELFVSVHCPFWNWWTPVYPPKKFDTRISLNNKILVKFKSKIFWHMRSSVYFCYFDFSEYSLSVHPRVEVCNSTGCQFHQHFTYKFFVQKSFRQLFSSYMYVEKSCRNNIHMKNSYVKCWWNWHRGEVNVNW